MSASTQSAEHRWPTAALDDKSSSQQERAFCCAIGRMAVRNLYAELSLYPKPGLVSLIDNGSHDDMTAVSFVRSLFSLRHYFIHITKAGIDTVSFKILKQLGIEAERCMLTATCGINTHRGAIFCVGMLCAAIGACRAHRISLSAQAIRTTLLMQWGVALTTHTQTNEAKSHGQKATILHAVSGAREEMALGLPSVFEIALPALQKTLAAGRSWDCARIDALFALMAHISDTNVYHRGGAPGADTVRSHAKNFIALGGTANPEWHLRALESHRTFIEKGLSPGGAADLLAATCFVHEATRRFMRK